MIGITPEIVAAILDDYASTSGGLTDEQQSAIDAILDFLSSSSGESFFLLEGAAGTGKTFCVKRLVDLTKGRLVFTAPTNKATKVLREMLTSEAYKPECRTIYSVLGLRLEPSGEVKVLRAPENPLDLSKYAAVVVDEASMVSKKLIEHIKETAVTQGVKFIFMGDDAQLPPVKEAESEVWKICKLRAKLTKVKRHDNQILALATAVRKQISRPAPTFKPAHSNANGEGVWLCPGPDFQRRILEAAELGNFSGPSGAKVIAWRNAAVIEYNMLIRQKLFLNAGTRLWLPEDRIILMEPVKNLDGNIVASTDDEGTVLSAVEDWHPEYDEFKIWRIQLSWDEGAVFSLNVLHEDFVSEHTRRIGALADAARDDRRKWKQFWDFKEAFSQIRHSYALTAHRAQGSTFQTAFVDWRDILRNRNRQEAFRCLYVACTRPSKALYLN